MKIPTKIKPFTIGLIIGLAVATVGTASAANNSKPGDLLYGADGVLEDVRLALTFGSEGKANLHSKHAEERIVEITTLLKESGYSSSEVEIALRNLIKSKKAVADLAIKDVKLRAKANALDDRFDLEEKNLKNAFQEAKRPLKLQEKQLKIGRLQALHTGDSEQVAVIESQIKDIKAQLNVLGRQEEDTKDALEVEEDRLEDLLDDEEKEEEEAEEKAEEIEEEEATEEKELEESEEALEEEEDSEDGKASEVDGENEEKDEE